jgi:hypothetical protein
MFAASIQTPGRRLAEVEVEWKISLNMSPPSMIGNTHMYLSLADVEQKMRDDGFDEYLLENTLPIGPERNKQRILYYLYGRQFDCNKSSIDRVARVNGFLQDSETRARMLHVMNLIKDRGDRTKMQERYWANSQMALFLYHEQDGVATVFKDHKVAFVCRLQHSLNCYLQAVSTLLGYKVAIGKSEEFYQPESFDVSKHIRHFFPDDAIYHHVVENGGCSGSFLERLVGASKVAKYTLDVSHPDFAPTLVQLFSRYGPGLVSCFRTDKFFKKGELETVPDSYVLAQFDMVDGKEVFQKVDLGKPTKDNLDDLAVVDEIRREASETKKLNKVLFPPTVSSTMSSTVPSDTTALSTDVSDVGFHASDVGSDASEGGPDAYDAYEDRPDAYEDGPDAYEGGPDAYEGGPDAYAGGPDAYESGPNASDGGSEAFDGVSNAFNGGSDGPDGSDGLNDLIVISKSAASFDTISSMHTMPTMSHEEAQPSESLYEKQDHPDSALHSMVLIGFRKEKVTDGEKLWFLLQNSWYNMRLVEVSATYLGAHVDVDKVGGYFFIKERLSELPSMLTQSTHYVVESALNDGGDGKHENRECVEEF